MNMDILIPKFEEMTGGQLKGTSLEKHYPEFIDFINEKYPNILSIGEKVYLYRNGLTSSPLCPVCGGILKFDRKYPEHCSRTCMQKDPEIIKRKKETLNKNFGAEGLKNEKIREKREQTCVEKYGVTSSNKSNQVKIKKEQTCIERYGGKTPFHSMKIQEKVRETIRERYGVENIKQRRILEDYPEVISIKDNMYECICPHPECNKCEEKTFLITNTNLYNRKYGYCQEICTKLNPIGSVNQNTQIEKFIKNILDEYNIKYETNIRTIITPHELDIHIPGKNLAIECNGCYWHSTLFKTPSYHLEKYKDCEDKKIHLLTIWEDWIINNPTKIKNIILSKLGIYNERIYARKCEVKEITQNQSREFINTWHLQNDTNSSIKIGLFYEGELLSVMTFGKRKLFGDNDWEMVRFCNKGGIQIVGGASKLLSQFIKDYKPSKIISFSSHDISNGNVYEKLGFTKENETTSSYWYVDKNFKRYHRYNFTKYRLVQDGYDVTKTEEQIMNERGFLKIYDGGQSKYVLNLRN